MSVLDSFFSNVQMLTCSSDKQSHYGRLEYAISFFASRTSNPRFTETFQQTLPNYEFPVVNKTLSGDDIDKHQCVFDKPVVRDEEGDVPVASRSESAVLTDQLAEDDLALTSPIVYGFSLADKLWRASVLLWPFPFPTLP